MRFFLAGIVAVALLGAFTSNVVAKSHVYRAKVYRATSKFGPLACRLSGGNPPIMHCYPVKLQQ